MKNRNHSEEPQDTEMKHENEAEDTSAETVSSAEESGQNSELEKETSVNEESVRLQEELEKLKAELASVKDSMLRRQADFENYKKRMGRQQDESRRNIIRDMSLEIIRVNDDLLRALDAASSAVIEDSAAKNAHDSFVQGVSMTAKQLESVLEKFGVEEIPAMNEDFNPAFHEAVEIDFSPEVESEKVTYVHQKGFKMNDIVVRSAKVRVTKPVKTTGIKSIEKIISI